MLATNWTDDSRHIDRLSTAIQCLTWIFEIDTVEHRGKMIGITFATDFPVRNDIQPSALLIENSQARRVILGGMKVLGDPVAKTGLYATGYENNGFMIIPPAALIVVGLIIWVQRSKNRALIEEN